MNYNFRFQVVFLFTAQPAITLYSKFFDKFGVVPPVRPFSSSTNPKFLFFISILLRKRKCLQKKQTPISSKLLCYERFYKLTIFRPPPPQDFVGLQTAGNIRVKMLLVSDILIFQGTYYILWFCHNNTAKQKLILVSYKQW